MNKKILRAFEEQFGKDWECTCKQRFDITNLEIISETASSLLAHYICSQCGKEQMLAASIAIETMGTEDIISLPNNQITSDDVLDIQQEVKSFKLSSIRALYRSKVKKTTTEPASGLLPPNKA